MDMCFVGNPWIPGEKESLLLICTLLSFFRMLETMSAADGTPLGRAYADATMAGSW